MLVIYHLLLDSIIELLMYSPQDLERDKWTNQEVDISQYSFEAVLGTCVCVRARVCVYTPVYVIEQSWAKVTQVERLSDAIIMCMGVTGLHPTQTRTLKSR